MFERITIRDAAQDDTSSISITFMIPQGWLYEEDNEMSRWLAFFPEGQGPRTEGFALLVIPKDYEGPEYMLGDSEGLKRYIRETLPDLEEADTHTLSEDVFAPYDMLCFKGKIPSVAGRVIMLGMAVSIEGFNFALFGFSRDENFDDTGPMFQRMITSFQPLVQSI